MGSSNEGLHTSAGRVREVSRRGAIASLAVSSAALVTGFDTAPALAALASGTAPAAARALPSASAREAETGEPGLDALHVGRTGSDFMVDAIQALGIEYVAINPGSSFRGLHESLVNYGDNKPQLLTCLHEEIAVALAHGYSKVAGKPMLALVHGPVGLAHASMAIFNAWCDRVPVIIIAGNGHDGAKRKGVIDWIHASQDLATPVRDTLKWDAAPGSLVDFGEALARADAVSRSVPYGPVLVVADLDLQEEATSLGRDAITLSSVPRPPAASATGIADIADILVAAKNPVIVVDAAVRTPGGMADLVSLAEILSAPVVDRLSRLNMPSRHPLNHTSLSTSALSEADVVLGLEVWDLWGVVNQVADLPTIGRRRIVPQDAKLMSIGMTLAHVRANPQDYGRLQPLDVDVQGDVETSLPALLQAVRQRLPQRDEARRARGAAAAERANEALKRDEQEARRAWDASPVTLGRLFIELGEVLEGLDWALVSDTVLRGRWPNRLWDLSKPYQYIGGSAGYGLGYGLPAAIGAALAHKAQGRIAVNIQPDGDMMYTPQALWTAAHHSVPILTIMHNNRSYNQEVMHVQRMACRHSRGIENAAIGNMLDDPAIDFAGLSRSMGVAGFGPISDPRQLKAALTKAVNIVKNGKPALVDIICQPR